jgi:hypothetical protein
MHKSHKGNSLYCIAANVFRPAKGWNIEFSYLHAPDLVAAKLGYCRAHPNRMTHCIIAASLAIGFFHAGFDKSGEVVKDMLTAD